MKQLYFLVGCLSILLLAACKPANQFQYIEGKVNIVATTTMLGDLAKEVGGDDVAVTTLMGIGVDPHLYQPKASDTNALLKADLVITNGLFLEGQMGEVLTEIEASRLLVIGDHIDKEDLILDEHGIPDPHIWYNVELWMDATRALGNKLKTMDEDNHDTYEERMNDYLNDLNDLHQYILDRVNELPEEKRVIVTAHDAFHYLGKRYGFEVHAVQGISTEAEASIRDIEDLVELMINLDVQAIFIESSVPEDTVRRVIETSEQKGHPMVIGGELFSDSLGDKESNAETYIKTVKHNIDTIIDALK